jgi:hypothetical protein
MIRFPSHSCEPTDARVGDSDEDDEVLEARRFESMMRCCAVFATCDARYLLQVSGEHGAKTCGQGTAFCFNSFKHTATSLIISIGTIIGISNSSSIIVARGWQQHTTNAGIT